MLPSGELSRAINHEASDEWPHTLDIVAYYGPQGRKGRSKRITITADQFFGRGAYNAPLTGDRLIHMIEQLRKGGSKA